MKRIPMVIKNISLLCFLKKKDECITETLKQL